MPQTTAHILTSSEGIQLSLESFQTEKLLSSYLGGRPEYIVKDAIKCLSKRVSKATGSHYPQLVHNLPPKSDLIDDYWIHIWSLTGPAKSSKYDLSACTLVTFSRQLDHTLFDELAKAVTSINWKKSSKDFLI